MAEEIFIEVHISYLLVGYTHNDIDASFRRWSMHFREHDYPNITLLMKPYMNMKNDRGIPHLEIIC